jgi:hypothetical protein
VVTVDSGEQVRRALDEADQRAHRESHAALGEVATNPVERGEQRFGGDLRLIQSRHDRDPPCGMDELDGGGGIRIHRWRGPKRGEGGAAAEAA